MQFHRWNTGVIATLSMLMLLAPAISTAQDYTRFFKPADGGNIRIVTEITKTRHPNPHIAPIRDVGGVSHERMDEWRSIQKRPRTQTFSVTLSWIDGTFSKRIQADQGELFIVDTETERVWDFNTMQRYFHVYRHGDFSRENGQFHDSLVSDIHVLPDGELGEGERIAGKLFPTIPALLGEPENLLWIDLQHSEIRVTRAGEKIERIEMIDQGAYPQVAVITYDTWTMTDEPLLAYPEQVTITHYYATSLSTYDSSPVSSELTLRILEIERDL